MKYNTHINLRISEFLFSLLYYRRLYVGVDARDDNYMPYHIVVNGGDIGNLKQLNDTYVDM